MCSGQRLEAVRGPTYVPHPTTEASVNRCSGVGGRGGGGGEREGGGEEA